MPNKNAAFLLPVPINPPVTLLHHVRIPGNLDVDEVVAVVLKVDPLGSGISCKQNAHWGDRRISLEGRLHGLAVVRVHIAVEERQAVAAVSVAVSYKP